MSKNIYIDPGLRGCGLAVFEDRILERCAYVRGAKDTSVKDSDAWRAMVTAVDDTLASWFRVWTSLGAADGWRLVSEFPKVYAVGKSKGDPEDLLQLAAVVGGLVAVGQDRCLATKVVRPYEWKRQVKKEIMAGRIIGALSVKENEILLTGAQPKSLAHNVIDAVGIGLNDLGRLGPGGTPR